MAFWSRRGNRTSAAAQLTMADLLREHVGAVQMGDAQLTTRTVGAGGGSVLGLLSARRLGVRASREPARLVEAYVHSPWVRAVVSRIADSVAATQWTLQRGARTDVGRSAPEGVALARRMNRAPNQAARRRIARAGQAEEIATHPALDVIEGGNPHFPGPTVAQLSQVYGELAGESILVKERDAQGMPIALYPIPPRWCAKRPLPTDHLPAFTFRVNGVEASLPATEVVWIQTPSPVDPYFAASGIASALADEIDVDDMAAKLERQTFLTGGIKPTLVFADGLTEPQTQRLQADMEQQTRGFWRAFRLYFVSKKLEFATIGATAREMELEKLRRFERDVIVHTWGIPPEIIGILETSNRATITAAAYIFARWVLVPRLEVRRAVLQAQLVADFGDPSLLLDYVTPIEEDLEAKRAAMAAAPWAFTQDEWRGLAGFGDVEAGKGKIYAVPYTLLFRRELMEGITDPVEPEPEPGDEPDDPPDDGDQKAARLDIGQLAQRALERLAREKAEGDEPEIDADTLSAILAAIAAALSWVTLRTALRPILGAVADHFGKLAAEGAGATWDAESQRMRDWRANGYAHVLRAVNQTTRDQVATAVSERWVEASSWTAVRTAADAAFEPSLTSRAAALGLTSTVTAAGFGTQEGLRQANMPFKDWVSERDERVRETHQALDESEPIPLEQDFVSPSGARGPHPGALGDDPAENANCILPGSYVSGAFVAGVRACYSGKAIELNTRHGYRLRVTPNHPVATAHGFVPAQKLNEGDHVLTHVGNVHGEGSSSAVAAQEEQRHPTVIEQVLQALAVRGTSKPRRTRPDELHGDAVAVQGDIDVVDATRELLSDRETAAGELSGERVLEESRSQKTSLVRAGSGELRGDGVSLAPPGTPSGAALTGDSRTVGSRPLQPLRFGTTADLDTVLQQPAGQNGTADAAFVRDLLEGYPGAVALDEIVQVRQIDYSGHVYDLQSTTGWMVASGIVVSNCRCIIAPAVAEGERALATEEQRDAAWKRLNAERLSFEAQAVEAARGAFSEQRTAVLDAIERVRQRSA